MIKEKFMQRIPDEKIRGGRYIYSSPPDYLSYNFRISFYCE